ncbi:type VI secretion system lipoprotein TssJ [Vibrio sp.]|nr:type VI secretion system lipoprotein TssJ [Vibrio sp.]
MKKLWMMVVTATLLSGCALFKDTSTAELNISASKVLNVRDGGQSSPVILRVYELSSSVIFKSVDFFALYGNEKNALGDEYIKRHEFQIQPGEESEYYLELDPETRTLGYAVAYRDINGSTWRTISSIEEITDHEFIVELKGSQIKVIED